MSSLADLPKLIGFFSYSREDEGAVSRLSILRERIKDELGAQLGRTKSNLELWQDKKSIEHGEQWEQKIKSAIGESVFFIPIITPRAVRSENCQSEFRWFLAREAELDRNDLFFPIHYIDVPELADKSKWDRLPVLKTVAERQYFNWHHLRWHDVESREVGEAVESFCRSIANAMRKRQLTAEERRREQEAEARRRAQEEERAAAEARQRVEDAARRIKDQAEARARLEQARREKEQAQLAAKEERRKRAKRRRLEEEALRKEAVETIQGWIGGFKRVLAAAGPDGVVQQPATEGAKPDPPPPAGEWAATIVRDGNSFSILVTGPAGSHRVEFSAKALAVDKLVIDGVARPAPRWPGKRNSHQFTLGSGGERFELSFAVDNLGIGISSIELSANGRQILQTG